MIDCGIRVLDFITKTNWCDILPNKHTMRFTVGTKIIRPEAIIAPTADQWVKRYTQVFWFLSQNQFVGILIFFNFPILCNVKMIVFISKNISAHSIKLVIMVTPQHFLWCRNGTCCHACRKHNEYFIFENFPQTTMYIDSRIHLKYVLCQSMQYCWQYRVTLVCITMGLSVQ